MTRRLRAELIAWKNRKHATNSKLDRGGNMCPTCVFIMNERTEIFKPVKCIQSYFLSIYIDSFYLLKHSWLNVVGESCIYEIILMRSNLGVNCHVLNLKQWWTVEKISYKVTIVIKENVSEFPFNAINCAKPTYSFSFR